MYKIGDRLKIMLLMFAIGLAFGGLCIIVNYDWFGKQALWMFLIWLVLSVVIGTCWYYVMTTAVPDEPQTYDHNDTHEIK